MPALTWFCDSFSGRYSAVNGRYDDHVPLGAMLHAAITVGKAGPAAMAAWGRFSRYERRWRSAMVAACLDAPAAGPWRRSPAYAALDPSEKGAVSYFVGLTVVKYLSERMFGVPWLVHLDQFAGTTNLPSKGERPDLVGADLSGAWLVAEAKGRSNGWDEHAETKAKQQTRRLRRINGSWPAVRVASQSYFEFDELRVSLVDPDEYEDGSLDLDVSRSQLVDAYYRWLLQLLDESGQDRDRQGEQYRVASLPELDAEVGMSSTLRRLLLGGEGAAVVDYLARRRRSGSVALVVPRDADVVAVPDGAPLLRTFGDYPTRALPPWNSGIEPTAPYEGLDGIVVWPSRERRYRGG